MSSSVLGFVSGGFGLSAYHPLLTGSKLLLDITGNFVKTLFSNENLKNITAESTPIIYNGYIHYIHANPQFYIILKQN